MEQYSESNILYMLKALLQKYGPELVLGAMEEFMNYSERLMRDAMNKVLEVDLDNLQLICEPGIIHDTLNAQLLPLGFSLPVDAVTQRITVLGKTRSGKRILSFRRHKKVTRCTTGY